MSRNKKGLTLIELLVSTILMGIVMLGVISVDFGIRSLQRQTSRTALLTAATSAILQNMAREASAITGSAANVGFGWQTGPNRLYLRQDIDINGNVHVPPTPNDFTDDNWVTFDSAGTTLKKCVRNNAAGACGGAGTIAGQMRDIQASFQRDNNSATAQYYILLTVINCQNPTVNTCFSAPTAANPSLSLSTRVYPISNVSQLPCPPGTCNP